MLADDLGLALDPAAFAEHVAGFTLDDWQVQAMRSTAPRVLFNTCRQSGKSTIAALIALHGAIFRPRSLALLLSPTLRQSGELFRKVLDAYAAVATTAPAVAESVLRIELANGSRIISLPGKETTVRGYSGVDLLVIDEGARVSGALYGSVRPMLAVSGGRLLALSTPFGTRGWFYESWVSAEPWERYEVPATECPRIPAEFLAEEKRTMGEWYFSQEYCCEFREVETAAFRREDIDAMFAEVEEWAL